MSTAAIIGIVIAIIVVVAAAAVIVQEVRRARLRRQLGPEYTRLAKELGSNRKAEIELVARRRRAAKLDIRPLTEEQQSAFTNDWTAVQERFVDAPAESVQDARAVVEQAMRERGYPSADPEEAVVALSVHNGRQLSHYRRSLDISGRIEAASTEELREAILGFREVLSGLLGSRVDGARRPQPGSEQTQLDRTSASASGSAPQER
ncbi:MAG: hypothetical protein JO345_20880 [Streptosporangiaceae bacterium]|nr:hypothetical protein [Streptosporangiaceae bacterium]